jgi:uncharacterized membrane protein
LIEFDFEFVRSGRRDSEIRLETWKFLLAELWNRLWLRASLYAALGVTAALLAAAFSPFVPAAVAKPFGGGTVNGLLNVLATSLLAVATFSVAAMLSAYTNVSQSASPRAAALITGDSRAQGALATFVGAFLYSVVAFSADGTGYYGSGGRAIVFFVTLVVLALVAINLLLWLDQLLSLARVGHAIIEVEKATCKAMESPFGRPAPVTEPCPSDAALVRSRRIGYVGNIDLHALEKLARKHGLRIWITAPPGSFVEPSRVLARVEGPMKQDLDRDIATTFVVGPGRSFSQDPRFGLIVLGQIASKALSPGINDPGTAIDVVASAVRLLENWLHPGEPKQDHGAGKVLLERPAFDDLVRDVFGPIAFDGSSSVVVSMRLQRALRALQHVADSKEARVIQAFAEESAMRSDKTLEFEVDRRRVRAAGRDRTQSDEAGGPDLQET